MSLCHGEEMSLCHGRESVIQLTTCLLILSFLADSSYADILSFINLWSSWASSLSSKTRLKIQRERKKDERKILSIWVVKSWRFGVLKLRITHVLQPLILIGLAWLHLKVVYQLSSNSVCFEPMEWSDQPDRCGGFNSRMFQKPSVISLSSSLVFLSQSHGFKGALVFLGCWSKAIESILRTSDRPSKNIDRVISSHLQSGVYSGSPLRGSFPEPGQAAGRLHPGGTGLDLPLSTDFTATLEKLGNDQDHLYRIDGESSSSLAKTALNNLLPRHATDLARSEVNERANPAQKPLAGELNRHAGQLAGELNHHAGQLAGELNHHAGQLAGELNRPVVALARRAQPPRRSARRRAEPSRGCVRRRVRPSRESARPASST
ncbi:hypothetical protein DY000_02059270 [Brassica cretica]|uniref:Uncharacterized protein n=1 Tax=Brassica cretica TaxID=69181 RepID=A0ABQ7AR59_BRACR|nr:hypothetical protein DY000_02059270 [Brassica cretica]